MWQLRDVKSYCLRKSIRHNIRTYPEPGLISSIYLPNKHKLSYLLSKKQSNIKRYRPKIANSGKNDLYRVKLRWFFREKDQDPFSESFFSNLSLQVSVGISVG